MLQVSGCLYQWDWVAHIHDFPCCCVLCVSVSRSCPTMEKKAKQDKKMTSKGANRWNVREFSIASDLDQASQKVVKLLVSLWGLLESLVFSSTNGCLCSCKAKRHGSRTHKLLFEALSQYPYASTKLLFLHPLTEMEEMERKNCDQGSIWVTLTCRITAFEWVLSSDSLLDFVAKGTTQPVFHWEFTLLGVSAWECSWHCCRASLCPANTLPFFRLSGVCLFLGVVFPIIVYGWSAFQLSGCMLVNFIYFIFSTSYNIKFTLL